MQPVCLVIGAGAGIGGHVARRFARGGYHAALCRRTGQEGLDQLTAEIRAAEGSASGHLMNAIEPGTLESQVRLVEKEFGPIEVLIYNLGAQIGDRRLEDTPEKVFELGWRMGVLGLFRVAQALCPLMQQRGKGTLLVTSSTAAVRGNAGQHSHAAAMGGRRMLCQSLNAQYGPENIHVSHVVIDGPVDAPDTLGKMIGAEAFRKMRETKGVQDGLLNPSDVAETYWHLAHQHRSAWTHEIDLRPFSCLPWWNH
ncbi:MAG TPA: short-chain dehydrogenase [Gammaproteobacteria bacterium]|nr:short-chain dehydrogenase [Gammaproteobacteria bacterium]|tara:strand:+ start:1379 stop:2140 length:762 start_codon:yes stop_codon:yes gene_type:complete